MLMFAQLFDFRSPFWEGVARLGDLIWVNMMFLFLCVPLVTAGAAVTALYDTVWHLYDERGGGTTRIFWSAFRSNFVSGSIIGAFVLLLTAGVALPWLLLPVPEGLLFKVPVSIFYLLIWPFFFYLQVRFHNSIFTTIKNAFMIPIVRLPYSAAALGVTAILVAVFCATATRLPALLWLPLLGGFGIAAYAVMPLLGKAVEPWTTSRGAQQP